MKIVELPAARHKMTESLSNWAENGLDDVSATRVQGRAWGAADLYWVTPEMTRVALDAALDLPAFSLAALLPSEVGLIHYDGGLPPLPVVSAPKEPDAFGEMKLIELEVDWLLWWLQGDVLNVGYGCLTERLHLGGFEEVKEPYVGMGIVDFRDYTMTIIPETSDTDGDQDAGDQEAQVKMGVVTMLAATLLMMQQESVAESRVTQVRPTKNEHRKGLRPGTVTTMSLRRMRVEHAAHDSSGRTLTHRHVVRGHWRQQAWGPARSLRRPTWVPSYVKGPEGAPLIRSEKIMVWRR
jgi:hypothetical protein